MQIGAFQFPSVRCPGSIGRCNRRKRYCRAASSRSIQCSAGERPERARVNERTLPYCPRIVKSIFRLEHPAPRAPLGRAPGGIFRSQSVRSLGLLCKIRASRGVHPSLRTLSTAAFNPIHGVGSESSATFTKLIVLPVGRRFVGTTWRRHWLGSR